MESICIEEGNTNKHLNEGLRILARIIARNLMARETQRINGDFDTDDQNDDYLQHK